MSVTSLSPDPSPESSSQPIARRIAGIAALFACALAVDPARIVPEVTALSQINTGIALHALIIPALAAIGLWLVIPSKTILAICVLMLAAAHTELGQSDLFTGYLYPALATVAGAYLAKTLLFANSSKKEKQQLERPQ